MDKMGSREEGRSGSIRHKVKIDRIERIIWESQCLDLRSQSPSVKYVRVRVVDGVAMATLA